ncbi:MAG TPA: rhodanese-like domain-containing protein [Vicinamibacterales bacterium]|jgi:rhodanese-related sulfurtransferase|nr:rhodanese-like domain-containing protein [Vicinamibacterales bacterium]
MPGRKVHSDIAASELLALIDAGAAPTIIDVRSRREFRDGHVPGARLIEFWKLLTRSPEIPASREDLLVLYCGYGPRAILAGAALRRRGFQRVLYLRGHMAGWRRWGLPQEKV